jgi:alcohol dehydrogenase (NADP+)
LRAACRASRERLGVDRLDAYLLHGTEAWVHRGALDGLADLSHAEREALTFPTDDDGRPLRADVSLAETWTAMEGLVRDGHVRHIGVCNVAVDDLAALHDEADVPPRVVQVEHHPRAPRDDLRAWCRERGVAVMGHTPLGPDGLLDDPAVCAAADAADRSPAATLLRWAVDRGVVPIPSTSDPGHAVENLDLFRAPLPETARERLDGLA